MKVIILIAMGELRSVFTDGRHSAQEKDGSVSALIEETAKSVVYCIDVLSGERVGKAFPNGLYQDHLVQVCA